MLENYRLEGFDRVIVKHVNSKYTPNGLNRGWLLFSLREDVLDVKRCFNICNSVEELNEFLTR